MLPKFNNYIEEGRVDNGYEALQDFFLSWTIRCSQFGIDKSDIRVKESDVKVYEYSRRIVYSMIYGNNDNDIFNLNSKIPDSFKVTSIKTKRQLESIDLLAELKVSVEGKDEEYVLNIENKWYSKLSDHQLNKYKDYVINNFKQSPVHLFITCDDCRKNYDREKEICKAEGYKYLTIGDISRLSGMNIENKTGNDLFDEYWFNF